GRLNTGIAVLLDRGVADAATIPPRSRAAGIFTPMACRSRSSRDNSPPSTCGSRKAGAGVPPFTPDKVRCRPRHIDGGAGGAKCRPGTVPINPSELGLVSPAGPQGPPGATLSNINGLDGIACVREGFVGAIDLAYDAAGTVVLTCAVNANPALL